MERNIQELGGSFSVFEAFSNHAEGKGLNSRDSFIAVRAVAHDAGQGGHFGQPPAIVLTFELDRDLWRHR